MAGAGHFIGSGRGGEILLLRHLTAARRAYRGRLEWPRRRPLRRAGQVDIRGNIVLTRPIHRHRSFTHAGTPLRVPAAASALALVLALSAAPALAQSQTAPKKPAHPPAQRRKEEPDSRVLKEVVVTGEREAIMTAQRIKQMSVQVVDSVVAADIGKLPDRSVTEVLQRIPGVAIDHTYRDIAGHTDPEHFQVEGAGVSIRGLTYVRSEVNGGDAFTANGGRQLNFDDVPPELLAGVDVYKNPDAGQIEGGIGGVVNLRTAKPFDFSGSRITGTAGGSWGDLSRGPVQPSASLLMSDRWHTGIGDVGALVDIAYSKARDRTDGVELWPFFPRTASQGKASAWVPAGQTLWVPDGSSWRSLRYQRTRKGAYVALQWRPTDNLETSLTYFGSFYRFHWDENAVFAAYSPYNIQPAPGTNFTFNSAGVFTSGTLYDTNDLQNNAVGVPYNDDTRSADKHDATNDFRWNLLWDVTDNLTLTTNAQYVRSYTTGDDFTTALGIAPPWVGLSINGSAPPSQSVPQAYMENPANYYWSFTQDGLSRANGSEWAWSEDADYSLGHGFFKSIRVGARAVDRSLLTRVSEPGGGYNWAAVSATWMLGWDIPNLAYLNQFPSPYMTYGFPNFYNGGIAAPSAVIVPGTSITTGWPGTFETLQSYSTALCMQTTKNPNCNGYKVPSLYPAPGSPPTGGVNTQAEHTYAAYVELPFGMHAGSLPIDGNVGVRVVRTVGTANGNLVMNQFQIPTKPPTGHSLSEYVAFPGFVVPLAAKNDYTDVLPSLNMVFHWHKDLQSHLAVSEGMSRPSFGQLQAYTTMGAGINNGVETFTGTGNGNPDLKPTKATQVDGTLEWYFAPTGSMSLDVFYKHLTGVVINQVFTLQASDTAGTPYQFTVTGPVNGASGDIKGLELNFQRYFDFLPGFLKGFGTQLNFTYVDSAETLDHPVTGAYCDSTSLGADNLNLNLNGCDTDGRTFGNLPLEFLSKYLANAALLYDRGPVSARLAYSWRSKYLMGVNVTSSNGTNAYNSDPNSPNMGQENLAYGIPLYGAAYGELDASLFYNIDEHVTLGFTALNVTDSTYKELTQQHIGMMNHAWYDSGRTYTAEIRVTM
jgi:iron complex outermembrane receptor protein